MRYALMRSMDISNGEGVGVSLFVQGCPFHCKGCFNQETWDFNKGKPWTDKTEEQFIKLVDRPYITRVTFLGGEPLASQNVSTVLHLIKRIKLQFPQKKIWVYSGYLYDTIQQQFLADQTGTNSDRHEILGLIDYLVDGQFIFERQCNLGNAIKWAGSTNQRVIDCKATALQHIIIRKKD